jgi:hypothetical protein
VLQLSLCAFTSLVLVVSLALTMASFSLMAAALINALGKKEGDTETDTKKATEEAVAKAQAEAEEAVKAEIDEAVTKGETEGKGQCPARLTRELRELRCWGQEERGID